MIRRMTAVRLFLLWMNGWRMPQPTTEEAPTSDFFIYVMQKLLTRHWPVSFVTLMVTSFVLPVVAYFIWGIPIDNAATYLFLGVHVYAIFTMNDADVITGLYFLVVPLLVMTALAILLKTVIFMLTSLETPVAVWYTVQYTLVVTGISIAITRRPG